MYSFPFSILIEKTPFLEYLLRAVKFIFNPHVETEYEIPNGNMKYSLWDIVSVISLFTVVTGFINLFSQQDYNRALSLFSSQFTFYFQFGYYAFWSTFIFFILYSITLSIRFWRLKLKEPFLCSLQYARFYALFLFLFFPLVAWHLNYILYEVSTIKEYVSKNTVWSFSVLGAFVYLYVRCLLNPISKYSSIHLNQRITTPAIFVISLAAFHSNTYAPSIGSLGFDHKKACEIMILNDKYKTTTNAVKDRMREMCETKT